MKPVHSILARPSAFLHTTGGGWGCHVYPGCQRCSHNWYELNEVPLVLNAGFDGGENRYGLPWHRSMAGSISRSLLGGYSNELKHCLAAQSQSKQPKKRAFNHSA